MSQPVVIGGPPAETALLKECIQTWIDRLAEPGLVQRAVFFNKAAYSDLRNIPEDRPIDFSQSHTWETVKEDYAVAIPIGSSRRAGMESSFTEPLLSIALDELGKRPTDFPNLRHVPSEFGLGEDLWWGEEISDL